MEILLIRHTETNKNLDNKFDNPHLKEILTSSGEKQINMINQFLTMKFPPIKKSIIISGPRDRSLITANKISSKINVPIIIIDKLLPINPGQLSGLSENAAKGKYPQLMILRENFKFGKIDGYSIKYPNGDNLKKYEKKIKNLLFLLYKKYINYRLYIVTHRSVILSILNILYKLAKQQLKNTFCYYDTCDCCIDFIKWNALKNEIKIKRFGGIDDWRQEM